MDRAKYRQLVLDDQDDLAACGPSLNDIHDAALLDQVVATAYENLTKTSLYCWRRLHTDASLLSALSSPPEDAIAKLDKAIIVSGAAGNGRLELILDLIEELQAENYPSRTFTASAVAESAALDVSGATIPCLAKPPSLATFQTREYQAPFILRSYASDWPALNERPWASSDYLRAVSGPARVVPVEVGRDYRTDDWSQKIMPWDTFLDSLDGTEPLYLAQHSLLMQFPALRGDIIVPDYVYAALPRQTMPPENDEQLVINAWLGPKDTVSPAHTDPYYNIYIQVAGYKTVWVSPPSSDGMYATGNTSAVDVFSTDQTEWPNFLNVAAQTACLGPGDVLYLPAGWWHAMRSESRSFSVSMWF
ncbi:hypothetical protein FB45DRAFT_911645 [Roridomyces roridus]|uniref:JmjC domain-containing protein n=1 Tax=Roridomyces roridus TaxID=1738132 RepID=A0AAD7FLX8_9AGAR|nr:hypothetical protein FB45DRAFT_911645 [Roridomyces roridus]